MINLFKLKSFIFLGETPKWVKVVLPILLLIPVEIYFIELALEYNSGIKFYIINSIVSSIINGIILYTLFYYSNYNGDEVFCHLLFVILAYFILNYIYSSKFIDIGFIEPNPNIEISHQIFRIMAGVLGMFLNVLSNYLPGYIVCLIIGQLKKIK